jgi:hypothetical protein
MTAQQTGPIITRPSDKYSEIWINIKNNPKNRVNDVVNIFIGKRKVTKVHAEYQLSSGLVVYYLVYLINEYMTTEFTNHTYVF